MEPVVGIFPSPASARRAAHDHIRSGFRADQVELLLPGAHADQTDAIPTEEAEQPGVGSAVGGVVGPRPEEASAGFGLGAATASLLLPGIGAVDGHRNCSRSDPRSGRCRRRGGRGKRARGRVPPRRPKDEIYLYENALAQGKGVVFVLVVSSNEHEKARRALTAAGAESLDAARENWWVGIRESPESHRRIDAVASRRDRLPSWVLGGIRPGSPGQVVPGCPFGLAASRGRCRALPRPSKGDTCGDGRSQDNARETGRESRKVSHGPANEGVRWARSCWPETGKGRMLMSARAPAPPAWSIRPRGGARRALPVRMARALLGVLGHVSQNASGSCAALAFLQPLRFTRTRREDCFLSNGKLTRLAGRHGVRLFIEGRYTSVSTDGNRFSDSVTTQGARFTFVPVNIGVVF